MLYCFYGDNEGKPPLLSAKSPINKWNPPLIREDFPNKLDFERYSAKVREDFPNSWNSFFLGLRLGPISGLISGPIKCHEHAAWCAESPLNLSLLVRSVCWVTLGGNSRVIGELPLYFFTLWRLASADYGQAKANRLKPSLLVCREVEILVTPW